MIHRKRAFLYKWNLQVKTLKAQEELQVEQATCASDRVAALKREKELLAKLQQESQKRVVDTARYNTLSSRAEREHTQLVTLQQKHDQLLAEKQQWQSAPPTVDTNIKDVARYSYVVVSN